MFLSLSLLLGLNLNFLMEKNELLNKIMREPISKILFIDITHHGLIKTLSFT